MLHADPTTDYKNTYSPYINETFTAFAQSKTEIMIHFKAINEHYPFMRDFIASQQNPNLILFHKLAKVFPNCTDITVWNDPNPKRQQDNIMNKSYLDEFRQTLRFPNKSPCQFGINVPIG